MKTHDELSPQQGEDPMRYPRRMIRELEKLGDRFGTEDPPSFYECAVLLSYYLRSNGSVAKAANRIANAIVRTHRNNPGE